jgi:hypothetical protein
MNGGYVAICTSHNCRLSVTRGLSTNLSLLRFAPLQVGLAQTRAKRVDWRVVTPINRRIPREGK